MQPACTGKATFECLDLRSSTDCGHVCGQVLQVPCATGSWSHGLGFAFAIQDLTDAQKGTPSLGRGLNYFVMEYIHTLSQRRHSVKKKGT